MKNKNKKLKSGPRLKTYDCSIEQVNYCRVVVKAKDEEDAREKAYRKWRKYYAHSSVSYVSEVGKPI